MKEVRKKSNDEAIRSLLIKAFRQHTPLAWDRMEPQQPQCGFGKQMICCTDCYDGPCRINPFSAEDQQTVCGRGRSEMVANALVSKVSDGTVSLVKLASGFGGQVGSGALAGALKPADDMLDGAGLTVAMSRFGSIAADALAAITEARGKALGKGPSSIEINMGVLKADRVNIIVQGHVSPSVIKLLADQAALAETPVNLVAVCGSEAAGSVALPILTNYQSQEVALLTGSIDAMVIGEQCVMPAVKHLADEFGIPVFYGMRLGGSKEAQQVVEEAIKMFRRRAGKTVQIPVETATLQSGFKASDMESALAKKIKGLVYLGGCGTTAGTQDASVIKAAKALVEAGYLVVTAGCAGASLAKAGLCDSTGTGVLPPVVHLGACTESGVFLAMAKAVAAKGIPVAALMMEIVHNKTLAIAVGFAAAGITTYVDSAAFISDADVSAAIGSDFAALTGGRILPLPELAGLVGELDGIGGKS